MEKQHLNQILLSKTDNGKVENLCNQGVGTLIMAEEVCVKDCGSTDAADSKSHIFDRLQRDKTYRQRIIIWLCLCLSYHILGWNLSIGGPALLDLKAITKCSLQKASLFFTAASAGYFVASFVISYTFDRFNRILHMVTGHGGLVVVMATIPWCSEYGLMLLIQCLKGFLCGICDIGSSTLLIHLTGKDVKRYMQVLFFSYTIGGMLSPIIAAPFLMTINEPMYANGSYEIDFSIDFQAKYSAKNVSEGIQKTSQVYKAYSIVAGLNLLLSVVFIVILVTHDQQITSKDNKEGNKVQRELPHCLLIPSIVTFVVIWFVAFTMEDTVTAFTATYAVKHFEWTPEMASYLTSVFWTSFSVGSFSAIFISNYFSSSKFLQVYCTVVMLTSISLVVTSIYKVDVGLWIFTGICGFCLSLNYPLLLSWIEEDFFHVTAKANAALTVSSSTGVIISPIIVGALMEMSSLYFSFYLLGDVICFFLLLIVGKVLSVKVKTYKIKNANVIVIEPDSTTEHETSLL